MVGRISRQSTQAPLGIKVLHVTEAITAGVGRHLLDLCVAMLRAGLDVSVACPAVREGARSDILLVDKLRTAGVPVRLVPMRRTIAPLSDARATRRLVELIREHNTDVVHAHSSKAGVLGRLAARAARRHGQRPVSVYTPNAFAFSGARPWWARQLYRGIERWLGRHATDALICVSCSELGQARRHAIAAPERMVLIENAIDVTRFAGPVDPAAAKIALGLDPGRPVVGFVGRLARQKGVTCMIKAALRVLEAGVAVQFLLVGEGELETALREMVRAYRVEDSVFLVGYRPEIPEVMAALDILMLPSLYEGLPYTLMEAMAAGRPVIASRVGGNRDLIDDGKNGLLVPPGDPTALAESVIRLLAEPWTRDRMGAQALAAAHSRPAPEEMARHVVDLYYKLLNFERKEFDV